MKEKHVAEIKEIASASNDSGHNVIANICGRIQDPVAVQLPRFDSLKRTIRRVREEIDDHPSNPQSIRDFEICGKYFLTEKGDLFLVLFLFYDSGKCPNV